MSISSEFVAQLKPTERKIVERVAFGLTNRAIARRLHLTEGSVRQFLYQSSRALPRKPEVNPRVAIVIAYLEGTGRLV